VFVVVAAKRRGGRFCPCAIAPRSGFFGLVASAWMTAAARMGLALGRGWWAATCAFALADVLMESFRDDLAVVDEG